MSGGVARNGEVEIVYETFGPNARLRTFPGVGHDLPRQLWPEIINDIRDLASGPRR